MLLLFIKAFTGWLTMGLITMAILLIFGQWYIDDICRLCRRNLISWKDSIEFFITVVMAWPLVLIALPFRSDIEN